MRLSVGDIFYHSKSQSWLDHGAIWRYMGDDKCVLVHAEENHPWYNMEFVYCDSDKDDIRIIHLDNPMFKEVYDLH